jgi:hypothetical protein
VSALREALDCELEEAVLELDVDALVGALVEVVEVMGVPSAVAAVPWF